jgi:ParB family transcriptional regulator, chromosome partitioning protein
VQQLAGLALRLVLSDHLAIPREGQPDLLTEAEQVFVPKKPKAEKAKGRRSSHKAHQTKASTKKEAVKKAA